jgi:hypothetical protein
VRLGGAVVAAAPNVSDCFRRDLWRPVEATAITSDSYRAEGQVHKDEETAFTVGTVVRCACKSLSGGERLIAVDAARLNVRFPP